MSENQIPHKIPVPPNVNIPPKPTQGKTVYFSSQFKVPMVKAAGTGRSQSHSQSRAKNAVLEPACCMQLSHVYSSGSCLGDGATHGRLGLSVSMNI